MSLRTKNLSIPLRHICRTYASSTSVELQRTKHINARDLKSSQKFPNGLKPSQKYLVQKTTMSPDFDFFGSDNAKKDPPYSQVLPKKLEALQDRKYGKELDAVGDQIFGMASQNSENNGKGCFTQAEKLIQNAPRTSELAYQKWVYHNFLRNLVNKHYYVALLFMREMTVKSLSSVPGAASDLHSMKSLNSIIEKEKSMTKEFFYYLIEQEKDVEKIVDVFNRYAVLVNSSGSAERDLFEAIVNAPQKAISNAPYPEHENLYERFMIFKEVIQVAQISFSNIEFMKSFLFRLCDHVDFQKNNDRRKFALLFMMMGYDLSFMDPAMFFQYYLRAFENEYGDRTNSKKINKIEFFDLFMKNMQSYGMKSWVIWDLLDRYCKNQKKMDNWREDQYLKVLEIWLENRKERVMFEKEHYETELTNNSQSGWLEMHVSDEKFPEIHDFLCRYGLPEDFDLQRYGDHIIALYLEHADWEQMRFLLYLLSDEALAKSKILKSLSVDDAKSKLAKRQLKPVIKLVPDQIYGILMKRLETSGDFDKAIDCLYELKRLYPTGFNSIELTNSMDSDKFYKDDINRQDVHSYRYFTQCLRTFLRHNLHQRLETSLGLIGTLHKFKVIDLDGGHFSLISSYTVQYLMKNQPHDIVKTWHQIPHDAIKKMSLFRGLFTLYNEIIFQSMEKFSLNVIMSDMIDEYKKAADQILDDAKSICSPVDIYFTQIFAVISAILNIKRSKPQHPIPEDLQKLIEYRKVPCDSEESLLRSITSAINKIGTLSRDETDASIKACYEFALNHPQVEYAIEKLGKSSQEVSKLHFRPMKVLFKRQQFLTALEIYNLFKERGMSLPTIHLNEILKGCTEKRIVIRQHLYDPETSIFNISGANNLQKLSPEDFPTFNQLNELLVDIKKVARTRKVPEHRMIEKLLQEEDDF